MNGEEHTLRVGMLELIGKVAVEQVAQEGLRIGLVVPAEAAVLDLEAILPESEGQRGCDEPVRAVALSHNLARPAFSHRVELTHRSAHSFHIRQGTLAKRALRRARGRTGWRTAPRRRCRLIELRRPLMFYDSASAPSSAKLSERASMGTNGHAPSVP